LGEQVIGFYLVDKAIGSGLPISGVILSDQVKSLDWRAKNAEKTYSLSPDTIVEVLGKLRTLLDVAG
jgi:mRNA interferase MazF